MTDQECAQVLRDMVGRVPLWPPVRDRDIQRQTYDGRIAAIERAIVLLDLGMSPGQVSALQGMKTAYKDSVDG